MGFLSEGRGKTFHQLTQQEQDVQKEEAFARATVAHDSPADMCNHFFCLNAAWLNEGRCPGGRPSVSVNKVKSRKFIGNQFPRKQQSQNQKTQKTPTTTQSPGECRGDRCGLFLGQLDQGLVGYAESTHVNRPRGKALLASWVGRCCRL